MPLEVHVGSILCHVGTLELINSRHMGTLELINTLYGYAGTHKLLCAIHS